MPTKGQQLARTDACEVKSLPDQQGLAKPVALASPITWLRKHLSIQKYLAKPATPCKGQQDSARPCEASRPQGLAKPTAGE